MDYPQAQIELVNKIFSDEKAKDPGFQLWLTPTSYHGLKDQFYWQTLRKTLNRNIKVIWTGEGVFNKTITSEQAKTITRLLGRQPILWDNYPVNDYTYTQGNQHQLIMGPLQGRSATLTSHIAGYISNPMLQPQASKLALQTIADYLENPSSYQPKMAWENAIENMPGVTNPTLFKTFVAVNTSSTLNPSGYSPIEAMISAYQNASSRSQKQAAEKKLKTEFLGLAKLPTTLPESLTDKELLYEIEPWLTKLGEEGQGGLDALAFINDPNPTKKQQLAMQIKRVTRSPYKIGEDIIAFMQWAKDRK
jgi:hyaluronoglucosaminidase